MKKSMPKWLSLLLAAILLLGGYTISEPTRSSSEPQKEVYVSLPEGTQTVSEDRSEQESQPAEAAPETQAALTVSEDGEYTTKEEVALYIHLYNHLPSNFIKKQDAQDLGWVSNQGNLHKVAPGKSIGGDRFGNYENLLPTKKGRKYFECDIDFDGTYRNAKRIIFSNDGLIYYTDDHYESFTLLFGEE